MIILGKNDKSYPTVLRIMKKLGWKIFADPFTIDFGEIELITDLALEPLLGLEKQNKRIILELKSYKSLAINSEFQRLIGQIKQYEYCLRRDDLNYKVYLTIPTARYDWYIQKSDYIPFLEYQNIKYLVNHSMNEEVLKWNPEP